LHDYRRELHTWKTTAHHLVQYDEYLGKAHPVGSRAMEFACRHLAEDRLELTDVHWRTVGLRAMLGVCLVSFKSDWNALQ
jgi:hypothetical protein